MLNYEQDFLLPGRHAHQFIFWWLFINPDSIHLFRYPPLFMPSVAEFSSNMVSYLANHKTSLKSMVLHYNWILHKDYVKTFENNQHIEEIIFCNSHSIPGHMLKIIAKHCKLKRVCFEKPFYCNKNDVPDWEAFWDSQKDTLESYITKNHPDIDNVCKCMHNPYELVLTSPFWSRLCEQEFPNLKDVSICDFELESLRSMFPKVCRAIRLTLISARSDMLPDLYVDLILQLFPYLSHCNLKVLKGCLNPVHVDKLRQLNKILREVVIELPFRPQFQLIQNLCGARKVVLSCSDHFVSPSLTYNYSLGPAQQMLPSLLELDVYAMQYNVSHEEFMLFLRYCPNLKRFMMQIRGINNFSQKDFIDELSKGKIGQSLEHFQLDIMKKNKFLGNIRILEALLKHLPNLKVIMHPTWCMLKRQMTLVIFEEMAYNYGMAVDTATLESSGYRWVSDNSFLSLTLVN